MIAAILALLAALVPLAVWWIKRRAAKTDDPLQQNRERYAQADADIARGDGVQAGVHGAADLDELDRLQTPKRRGQGDQRGPNVDPPQAGQAFRAQCDGWFISDALYQRYRRAVAYKILEEQSKPADQK